MYGTPQKSMSGQFNNILVIPMTCMCKSTKLLFAILMVEREEKSGYRYLRCWFRRRAFKF
ncbi:hypothetical protein KUTeg_024308 [Tegillarca granosa]|uniref:Uncharacterized protein n=1 Tax=Tegillarca granosa TaxID=220873 RepID=A0ABQ9E2I2_TEGGR|nr:hypothetical protein KUTeg_024308 [Tegillarca granosa]